MIPRSSGWGVAWLIPAFAVLALALVRPEPLPGLAALLLLGWSALRRRPVALPRAMPWLLALPFALWWIERTIVADPRPEELLGIAAWFLATLSLAQLLAGTRAGGWRTWNAVAAVLLAGFHPGPLQKAIVVVLVVLVLLQTRLEAARTGASAGRRTWGPSLLAVALLAFLAVRLDVSVPMRGFDSWRPAARSKGFSTTLRLGGGFGLDPDPADDEIVLRMWTDRPPRFVKGAVFDRYAQGTWTGSNPWIRPASSRNHLEYSVYCLGSDTLAPPSGWASASEPTEGRLLAPSGSACVGLVADTVGRTRSGEWKASDAALERGWLWFPGALPMDVGESERRVPRGYGALLDSALRECGADTLEAGAALRRVGEWCARAFRYSLQPRARAGEEPLRAFLRDREGYCEHFATLAALLARRLGVPSRVATGYAYPEPSGGAWVFRRSHAHAWVEVFLPGKGWTSWDPTPTGIGMPPRRDHLRRFADAFGSRLVASWHLLRDGAWRTDLGDRLERLSAGGAPWMGAAGLLVGLALLGAWRIRRRTRLRDELEPWREGLERAEARLRREGFARMGGETVGEFLARLPDDAHGPSRSFLADYQRARWAAPRTRHP